MMSVKNHQMPAAIRVDTAIGAISDPCCMMEIAPIAVSTRMAAGIWWFFTLIMVSSYTANLAAFLTVETPFQAFRHVEDLANQNPQTIKYGAKSGGSTAHFFRDSNHPTYRKIWQYMQDNPEVMTSSNEEGVARVLNDKYAFFMESASIEYEVERKCDLTQVGSLLDNKGYGIAMQKDSPYRHALITSLLTLQENGKLTQLKKKWWKEKRGGGACEDDNKEGAADELGMDNVGGVFVVLVTGSSLALLISFFEVLLEIWKKKDKVSFKQELMEEIKFILGCKGSLKPVRRCKSEARDNYENHSGSLRPFQEFNTERKDPLE
uniref:Ionotropic glutamate receptor C-terminal domain-containing protein n=1 Tax=Clastoptera arizonana TaxID=38151 RepID=A0A1B6DDF8_9HEMI